MSESAGVAGNWRCGELERGAGVAGLELVL